MLKVNDEGYKKYICRQPKLYVNNNDAVVAIARGQMKQRKGEILEKTIRNSILQKKILKYFGHLQWIFKLLIFNFETFCKFCGI